MSKYSKHVLSNTVQAVSASVRVLRYAKTTVKPRSSAQLIVNSKRQFSPNRAFFLLASVLCAGVFCCYGVHSCFRCLRAPGLDRYDGAVFVRGNLSVIERQKQCDRVGNQGTHAKHINSLLPSQNERITRDYSSVLLRKPR